MIIDKPILGEDIYLDPSFADGLVGCFLFNDGPGNPINIVNPSFVLNSKGGAPVYGPGMFGSAWEFNDGTSEYFERDEAILFSYPMTILAWVMTDNLTVTQTAVWIGDKDVSNKMTGIGISGASDGDPATAYSYYGNFRESTKANCITVNKWHQLVGVFASPSYRLIYVDSLPGTANTEIQTPNGHDRTSIGGLRRSAPIGYWSGKIDHVMIFNRVLMASEIAYLYQEPFWGFRKKESGVCTRV